MIKFVLSGETPAKKNSRIVLPNGRNIPSRKYQEWHKVAKSELEAQSAGQSMPFMPLEGPLHISFVFYHGDKRRRDSDNGTSSVLDTLVDAGIIQDDNWEIVRKMTIENHYQKGAAHCEVTIAPMTI